MKTNSSLNWICKVEFCDFAGVYILVRGNVKITGGGAGVQVQFYNLLITYSISSNKRPLLLLSFETEVQHLLRGWH